ncbi:GNAT family N-acetyltransferase [Nocardioides ferulae]|uniref:GNAT family N-acetyltransferase n=1 Tax=Nocardioides ferulae TaxID=2340821 RepID=UPI000EB2F4D3|nr:GNAT family N-acetyltransferase [Nocardioides ferulae]
MLLEVVASHELAPERLAALRSLWQASFPHRFTADDEQHALGGVHAVAWTPEGEPVAHASVVPRTILVGGGAPIAAGYVEAVCALPSRQLRGLGSAVMRLLGDELVRRHHLGVLSTGAHHFYERLGWERWLGPSYVISGGRARRSRDDDDGLMVLRFGPTATLSRTQMIACHDRPGDAW